MKKLVAPLSVFSVFGLLLACFALNAQNAPIPPAGAAPLAVQNFHEKFMQFSISAYGPKAIVAPAFSASLRIFNPPSAYPRDWREGTGAFARNYADGLARRTAKQAGRFAAGALLHEDFRYRRSSSTNPLARGWHAVAFTFVDKSDSGQNRIAVANFAGAAASGFVGELYLPPGFNNLSHAETRTALAFGSFVGQNLLREFAPDLNRLVRKLGLPHMPMSDWWVQR